MEIQDFYFLLEFSMGHIKEHTLNWRSSLDLWSAQNRHLLRRYPKENCPDLYLLIHPPRRLLALKRERIIIPGYIGFPPSLAVYDFAYSLPLWRASRNFPFTEEETRRHFSYFSGTFIEFSLTRSFYIRGLHLVKVVEGPGKYLNWVL